LGDLLPISIADSTFPPTACSRWWASRALRIPRPFLIGEPSIELLRDGDVERVEVPAADSYRPEFRDVSAAIRSSGSAARPR
jgi:hypothetical protein